MIPNFILLLSSLQINSSNYQTSNISIKLNRFIQYQLQIGLVMKSLVATCLSWNAFAAQQIGLVPQFPSTQRYSFALDGESEGRSLYTSSAHFSKNTQYTNYFVLSTFTNADCKEPSLRQYGQDLNTCTSYGNDGKLSYRSYCSTNTDICPTYISTFYESPDCRYLQLSFYLFIFMNLSRIFHVNVFVYSGHPSFETCVDSTWDGTNISTTVCHTQDQLFSFISSCVIDDEPWRDGRDGQVNL